MLHKLCLLLLLLSATSATAQRYSEYELRELASLPSAERDSVSNAWFSYRRLEVIYGSFHYPALARDLEMSGVIRVRYIVDSTSSVRILDTLLLSEPLDEVVPSENHIEVIGYIPNCCYPNGCNTFVGPDPLPWWEGEALARKYLLREVARVAKMLGPVQALAGDSMPSVHTLYFEFGAEP